MTERETTPGTLTSESAASAPRACRYPGCGAPTEPGDGRGRPPEYCVNPAHTRASAFRARKEAEAAGSARTGQVGVDDAGEPVTLARARAGMLVERVEAAVAALSSMTQDVVAELRTLGDVEAVAVELETVSASAEQRAAEARSAAATADARRRRAEAAAEEAGARRDEAEAAAEEAIEAESQARALALEQDLVLADAHAEAASLRAALEEVTAGREEALTQAHALAEQLRGARAEIEGLTERVGVLTGELQGARDQIARAAQAAADQAEILEQTIADRETARAQVEQVRAQLEAAQTVAATHAATAAAARADADRLRGELQEARSQATAEQRDAAGVRAEAATMRAELTAAREALDVERTHGQQRVDDVRASLTAQISQLRADLEAARTPSE